MKMGKFVAYGMGFLLLFLLAAACEAVFTYSPVAFLQRDPANLPPSQKKTFAEDALASGDSEAILKAYDAIKGDAGDSADPALQHLAAKLALELSGVTAMLSDIVGGEVILAGTLDPPAVNAFLAGLDSRYTSEAGGFFDAANTNGADLSPTDYLLGGACLLFAAADSADIVNVSAAEADSVKAFVQDGIDSLPPGDPSLELLDGFHDFLDTEF
jgi:hypothetical protein